jgi:hypothetical protein
MQIRHILKKITFKSSPLKLLNKIKANLAGMVPGEVPFKIVSDSPALHSRWLPFFLFLAWPTSWLEVRITGHNFGRGPSKDYSTKVWFKLAQWLQRS